MVKTSIIVPVYNTSEYLPDCFESIFKQTQKEIEVIAVNDGSTDNSLSILEEIKKQHPEMIIISQENQGAGSARNKGIELATGEFIYFMDSDDCLVDTAMETCYYNAKKNKLDILMFDAESFGDIKHEKGTYIREDIIIDQWDVITGEDFVDRYWPTAYNPSICINYISVDFLRKFKLRQLSKTYYEDNEFCCKLFPLADRIMYIPLILYKRRFRKDSVMTSAFDMRHAMDLLFVVTAISKLKYNDRILKCIQEIQLILLNNLFVNCKESNLIYDTKLVKEIYDTILNIFEGTVESINLYRGIELLERVSDIAPDNLLPDEIGKTIYETKKNLLDNIFTEIPFEVEGKYVGIYGTGKYADSVLDQYRSYVSEMKANIIFIDSTALSHEKMYRGFKVYNINDIADIPLECLVIASSKYEWEMYRMAKEKYGNRFKIIRFRTDLHL